MTHYDLIVIGAGPGGTPAAMAAAQFGKKVLIVDKRGEPGGECLFEGCIPSKILENAANRYVMLKNATEFHIDLEGAPQIHWEQVIEEKKKIVAMRSQGALKQMEAMKSLEFKAGAASFVDAKTIEVGDEKFSFDKAVIATGAVASLPPIAGEGLAKAWTNADVFKQTKLPEEIAFIGAGAISCELVQMFAKLGVKCHLLERGPRILKRIDEEAALTVQKRMQEQGIDVILGVEFHSVDGEPGNFTIRYAQNGEEKSLAVPNLLVATGRRPNVEGLGLEAAGVEYDRHGIKVDAAMQTSVPEIYAVGDCAVGPKFAHWATYTAGIAIHNLFAPSRHEADASKLSWVLFCDPQIASAGLSEDEAQKAGKEVEVIRYDYRVDARAQIDHAPEGLLKFVIDKSDGGIVGIQIVSEDASGLSGEAALIVAKKMKPMEVMGAIHPHPTLTEAFGKLAQSHFFQSMMRRPHGGGKPPRA
ncbi:dihydrolipoyl dehydrogenase family protein [Nitratifractor sp.]